jgi:hypothetical protein
MRARPCSVQARSRSRAVCFKFYPCAGTQSKQKSGRQSKQAGLPPVCPASRHGEEAVAVHLFCEPSKEACLETAQPACADKVEVSLLLSRNASLLVVVTLPFLLLMFPYLLVTLQPPLGRSQRLSRILKNLGIPEVAATQLRPPQRAVTSPAEFQNNTHLRNT